MESMMFWMFLFFYLSMGLMFNAFCRYFADKTSQFYESMRDHTWGDTIFCVISWPAALVVLCVIRDQED